MDSPALEQAARALLESRKTLLMATARCGMPTASYAPFVYHEHAFYVYTSTLSRHTRDLRERKQVSVLLIQDEKDARNIFARERITFTCAVDEVPRSGSEWSIVMDRFAKRFGKIFELIRPLADFTLFRLKAKEATYVRGFGQAYRMGGTLTTPVHVRGTGPGAKAMPRRALTIRANRKSSRRRKQ